MSDPRVHPDARGFDCAAEVYDRARPEYPRAAVDWLIARLGLAPGKRVLDLAAGTGKLTRQLLVSGADVVAVEPSAGMRERLQTLLPVPALDGTAEAIPLADGDVDAVTIGQAFHWFRPDDALPEIHRVLRPGGGLGLIWNTRDESDPLQHAASQIVAPLRRDAPSWKRFDVTTVFDGSDLFGEVEERRFDHRQEVDSRAFVDRFLSVSFVAAAAADERARVADALAALVSTRPEPLVIPYVTEVYVSFRR